MKERSEFLKQKGKFKLACVIEENPLISKVETSVSLIYRHMLDINTDYCGMYSWPNQYRILN
jgi:hypothetical protein